jgi:hypothetical protein
MAALVAAARTQVPLPDWVLLGKVITGALALHFPAMAEVVAELALLGLINLTHLLQVALVWRHQSQEPQSLALAVAVAAA